MFSETVIGLLVALGKAYVVGGSVRDSYLDLPSKDLDIEVFDLSWDELVSRASQFGEVKEVGKSFGVLKLQHRELGEVDLSMPRTESLTGVGHRGFEVTPDSSLSLVEAASRRDFTVNTLSWGVDGLNDPFSGLADLKTGVLRHTSDKFSEDPLRVLRGMQFASRFNLVAAPDTISMCNSIVDRFEELSKDRLFSEWEKWAKGSHPSQGILFLMQTGWAQHFPEIADMQGVEQDSEWHPEGWSISSEVLSIKARLAGSTDTVWVDSSILTFREFLSSTLANFAAGPELRSTLGAQSTQMNMMFDGFSTTSTAGTFGFDLTSGLFKTANTESVGFMWNSTREAVGTGKVVRVMFEISKSRMLSIMLSAVDDLEIINSIVEPVSIFVMNMLFGSQLSTEFQFHQNAMNSNTTLFTRPTRTRVAITVADTTSTAINSNVVVGFDLCFVGDVDFSHCDFLVVDVEDSNLFYTKITQGCVLTHTLHVVDAAAAICTRDGVEGNDRTVQLLAALCHDMAKPTHTQHEDGRVRSRGHEKAGEEPTRSFLARINCPYHIVEDVVKLVVNHLAHCNGVATPRSVNRLANRLTPITIQELAWHVEADHSGRPPLPKGLPQAMQDILDVARSLNLGDKKPEPILLGRHLLARGMNPGPDFRRILDCAFQAQLDCVFVDLPGAHAWLEEFM